MLQLDPFRTLICETIFWWDSEGLWRENGGMCYEVKRLGLQGEMRQFQDSALAVVKTHVGERIVDDDNDGNSK